MNNFSFNPTALAFSRPKVMRSPEKNLVAAILVRAILDMCEGHRSTPIDARRARRWVRDVDKSPGGFSWICEALDFDEKFLREKLLSMDRKELIKMAQKIQYGGVL